MKKIRKRMKGLLSVESAMVLPLFLFAIVSVFSIITIMSDYLDMHNQLVEKTKKAAVYACLPDMAAEVLELENVMDEDDITLYDTKKLQLPVDYFSINGIRTTDAVRVKKWTGYNRSELDDDNEEMVYITTGGTVYHSTKSCTHLSLSVKSIAADKVKDARNESGGKYSKCSICCKGGLLPDTLYITEDGTRYHSSLNCSSLKRHIVAIPRTKVGNRTPCKRCGG